mmetsp:Transcript_22640/g.34207  ORF Transcript_22640/g.34207 Transcript_22640/m.34207 type:complete len:446 (+) Transcript_22640:151-1488(+)
MPEATTTATTTPPSNNVLLVGGFGDGRVLGTTMKVKQKLKKWARKSQHVHLKIKSVYSHAASVGGQSLRRMASTMRKRLKCSIEDPYCGIIYAYSMGSLLVKMGIVEGWIQPTAVCFCCGAHLGIAHSSGRTFERVYWLSDSLRGALGVKPGAVKSMRNANFTETLDAQFGDWLEHHPHIPVTFVGHQQDEIIPIESSVPQTHLHHAHVTHHIFDDSSRKTMFVHLRFPYSKRCLNIITSFIEANSSVSKEEPSSIMPKENTSDSCNESHLDIDITNVSKHSPSTSGITVYSEDAATKTKISNKITNGDSSECHLDIDIDEVSGHSTSTSGITVYGDDIERKRNRLLETEKEKTIALVMLVILAVLLFGLLSYEFFATLSLVLLSSYLKRMDVPFAVLALYIVGLLSYEILAVYISDLDSFPFRFELLLVEFSIISTLALAFIDL